MTYDEGFHRLPTRREDSVITLSFKLLVEHTVVVDSFEYL